jgi:acyl carrier protein
MATTETTTKAVEDALFDAIAHLGPARSQITRESTFESLDLDSLDLVEIAQVVEEKWGVEFDPQDFSDVNTVGEAIDLVAARVT